MENVPFWIPDYFFLKKTLYGSFRKKLGILPQSSVSSEFHTVFKTLFTVLNIHRIGF